MTFGFERALEIMRAGGFVMLDMDAYFLHKGVFYKDEPAVDDDGEHLIYGVHIQELQHFTVEEILSDEWWESSKKL